MKKFINWLLLFTLFIVSILLILSKEYYFYGLMGLFFTIIDVVAFSEEL
jgi:hypothetical protein